MARCSKCENKAVMTGPALCKKHFIHRFERKVRRTITNYKLAGKKDRILVAASGGKDSTAVMYLLKRFHYDVHALAIDEGIRGYRNKTLKDLKRFCKEHSISLQTVSFKEEFGLTLDQMAKKLDLKQCTICGVLRRYLLNKYSHGYDKIATGHNLDDESQSITMNVFKGNVEVQTRLGPLSGAVKTKRFTPRIKPLYLCSEKEVATYTFLQGLLTDFVECPYAADSYRASIRDMLNGFELKHPGTKRNIVNFYLKSFQLIKKSFPKTEIASCKTCKSPASSETCKTCQILKALKEL